MKIAMIGHKDFPCRSGGVEVVVYELATRLAARGEDVTVYNRGRQRGHNRYRVEGVNVIRSFTFRRQSLNAMVYSFTATLGALRRRYDIMHYHAIGPCVPLVIAHAFGRRTVATVHGLNWRVDKWRGFASKYIRLGERIAAKYADEVITLSDEMHRYFLDTYGRDTALIRNAVSPVPPTDIGIIREKYGLEKNGFILYVGRISPEKGIDELIEAYKRARPAERLIIAGEIGSDPFGCAVRAAGADAARGNVRRRKLSCQRHSRKYNGARQFRQLVPRKRCRRACRTAARCTAHRRTREGRRGADRVCLGKLRLRPRYRRAYGDIPSGVQGREKGAAPRKKAVCAAAEQCESVICAVYAVYDALRLRTVS